MVLQNVTVVETLPLPDYNEFVQGAWDKAFPQVVAFCAAILGVLAVSMVIKAFTKGG
jgi:hypothetical protein